MTLILGVILALVGLTVGLAMVRPAAVESREFQQSSLDLRGRADYHAQEEASARTLAGKEKGAVVQAIFLIEGRSVCRTIPAPGSQARASAYLEVADHHARLEAGYRRAALRPRSAEAWEAICREHITHHVKRRNLAQTAERERMPRVKAWEATLEDLRRRKAAGTFTCDPGFLDDWARKISREREASEAVAFHSQMIENYERAGRTPGRLLPTDPPDPTWAESLP